MDIRHLITMQRYNKYSEQKNIVLTIQMFFVTLQTHIHHIFVQSINQGMLLAAGLDGGHPTISLPRGK